MERRGQVTRVLSNYGQLETGGTEWLERKVKPSLSGTSRATGDGQARFCEGLGVKFPGPTRPSTGSYASYMAEIPTSSEDKLRKHAARPNCLLCDLICLRRGQLALQTLDL